MVLGSFKKIIPLTRSNEPFTVSGAKKSMVGKLNIKLNRTPLYHLPELPQYDLLDLQGRRGRQIFAGQPAMRARPPAKPDRHSPEAKPMADGPTCHCEARAGRQGEAA